MGFFFKKPSETEWFFQFCILLFGLAFCGVILDHIADIFRIREDFVGGVFGRFFSIAEDGGEMILGSLLAGHAFEIFGAAKHLERGSM